MNVSPADLDRDHDRDLDLVLMGATGFTGGLTAEHLAAHAPRDLRWALAGRSAERLEAVRARLAAEHPHLVDLPLVVADSGDEADMARLAASTRLVVTTVGPYLHHGEALVAACAAAGTDYVDLTGEPEFVDRTWLDHHATAEASGARLVHACGFDSVPHDLGALFTVQQLPDDVPIELRGVVRSSGTFSGGTFHSAVNAMSRLKESKQAASARHRQERRPEGRTSRAVAGTPRRDPVLGYWLLPLPTLDAAVVARSGAALPTYGPKFRYAHFAGTKTLRYAAGGAVAVGALAAVAQLPLLRRQLLARVPQGVGPDPARRDRAWFTVDFVGETVPVDGSEPQRVHTRVSGGDPGYTETAKMLAEAALSLLLDDNPPTSGQVTTAQAMGEHLTRRLQDVGIRFEVVSG
ncbi:saccharopine dehydrogenase family protein [Nocardioides solisilvae]|uniref:saccharopine dehydrogenase family protein n=1 Tax=Nocardioides solisilvae TaxID=1542435 RepID=UPI000D740920|nr:saccharopine dehydrogenase NADP-binding domain-containing protein [Nocardioides solisilvae]